MESSKKSSNKDKKVKKCPGTDSTARVPKKVCFEKHCNLCKKHGGAYTMHNTRDCHRFEKDGKEKSNFCTAKKGRRKGNPIKPKLCTARSLVRKGKSAVMRIVILTLNRELGWVVLGK
jgi:hypothetical protein